MAYTLALRVSAPALAHAQRLLLKVEGEQIVSVEYRPEAGSSPFFTRTGGRGAEELIAAATSACPTCGTAHGLALCQAVEALAEISLPPRAEALRLAAAELERAASHLATVGAIFEALALPATARAFAAEGRRAHQALSQLAGGQLKGWLRPGGLSRDIDSSVRDALAKASGEALDRLFALADRTIAGRLLLARTVEVGVITASAAEQFGLSGPLARAAGLAADLRIDAPYGAYVETQPTLVSQEGGDVYARLLVLILEALESLKLVGAVINQLPPGTVRGKLPASLPAGSAEGTVEAPRGPLSYRVEADGSRLDTVSCRPAPQLDRLLARAIMQNAALDDSALIVVSTDPCDACLSMRS